MIDAAGQALADADETIAHALADAAGDPSLRAAVLLRIAWKHNIGDGDPCAPATPPPRRAPSPRPAGTRSPRPWP